MDVFYIVYYGNTAYVDPLDKIESLKKWNKLDKKIGQLQPVSQESE